MTLDELKSMSNVQGRLQQAIQTEYGVSLPVSDLVRRASMNPELLQLEKYEKPLYALCFLYKDPFVKDILDEINEDYNNKESVKRYIANYFKQRGAQSNEEIRVKMQNAITALPIPIQREPTCNNFKLCKYIELTELEDGRYANITDALVSNKEAFVDYGGEIEDLIDDGVPIEMANRIASENTIRRYKLAEALAAPVRMTYTIRDSVEQSIAAGLGKYGDEYLANRAEIRERKELFKKLRMEAQEVQKLDDMRQGKSTDNQKYNTVDRLYNNNSTESKKPLTPNTQYKGKEDDTIVFMMLFISLFFVLVSAIAGLIRGGIMRLGFLVTIGGLIVAAIAIVKKHAGERGWIVVSLGGMLLSVLGLVLTFTI